VSAYSRRALAERLALAVAAPFILEDVAFERGVILASPDQEQEPSPLAKTLAESIRLRYGTRLSAADMATITRSIDARLRGLERLYQVPLANADEPDFVFSVYRGPD
jgi:hypothetical protein